MKIELHTGTHVPTRISAPAAARDFAIAHPQPLSSAIPAINALFPADNETYASKGHQVQEDSIIGIRRQKYSIDTGKKFVYLLDEHKIRMSL